MQIKNRQKFLLIIVIACLALLVGDSLVIEPLIASWNARNKHIADLKKDIAAGQIKIDHKAVTQKTWNEMRKNALPTSQSKAESEMLRAFERWSEQSRISISSIKPQWKQTDDDYMTLICRADMSGSLDALTRFIYEAEKDPLALKIEALEITSQDNEGQQLSLGLQISGLFLTPKKQ